ncbi:hypothetical protein JKP88DRAFT_254247 [Tribonema minus]|uniref:Uncharacterized protein n=1 Tax=Tribonema minus TaxID=303371 RepID=A0A835ZDM4_9STRA|nr:hypothetical protein JKP88DRAFT_254247 [Tribonema minus]
MRWRLVTAFFLCVTEAFVARSSRLLVARAHRLPVARVAPTRLREVVAVDAAAVETFETALFGLTSGVVQLGQKNRFEITGQAAEELANTYSKPTLANEDLVDRECFMEGRTLIANARKRTVNVAHLVWGSRGGGKTVYTDAALQFFGLKVLRGMLRVRRSLGMPGVLKLTFAGDASKAKEWITKQVLGHIRADWANQFKSVPAETRLRLIAEVYKFQNTGERLVVLLDVGEQTTPSVLTKLLAAIKDLGYEQKLITFVVVVSASRSAMALPVDLMAARARPIRAPEFTVDEAHALLRKQLANLAQLPDFISLAKKITAKVGTRPVHLVEVCERCQLTDAKTAEACIEQAEAVAAVAEGGVEGFMNICVEKKKVDRKEAIAFLQKLSEPGITQTKKDA